MNDFSHLLTANDHRLRQYYHARASSWELRTRTLEFGNMPTIMGIVNVTPDSFSDGGKFSETDAAIEHALRLADEGAGILDIGGESTRPGSQPVSVEEELKRVTDVVREVCRQTDVPVSIDTSKAAVAEAAVNAGAEIINDVTGLEGDPKMTRVAKSTGAGVCVMHMQGDPQTMQDNPTYDQGGVVHEISKYLKQRKSAVCAAGIKYQKICLDPGIGFGKTHRHNFDLMVSCGWFHHLSSPLLVGHSRKGFIAKIIGDKDADRTLATVGASITLALQGVQVIRVHDVREHVETLKGFEATGGLSVQTPNHEETL